ncbi:GtrA family protein [Paenibacillus sp. BSR1-1]|uniref:GtrA family protein n=1 Tax=Paenibacillus sp. BSR1-1 TaxID=3020845 RepID=UPI0025B27AFB|nr:GtrA family protein [Paenibacillus sp. BSR1-1]MDN3019016.1 GtrA family protein [Paenibacillus sp. BSR1-1]
MTKFLKFGAVGIFNTLITIGSFTLFVYLGINYILANTLAYGLGTINSFFWNKNWVFQERSGNLTLFVKFVIVNIVMLGFNTLTLYLLVDQFKIGSTAAQVFSTFLGMMINFLFNQKWTFSKKKPHHGI